MMRAFRNRLQEVSREQEALKSRKGEHSSELQAKHRRVLGELYEAQELAQSFDRKNQQLQAENQRLQDQLRTRADDRSALLKELVMTKKETARLKAIVKEAEEETHDPNKSQGATNRSQNSDQKGFFKKDVDYARMQQTQNKLYERELSYRETVEKLKKTLEAERRQCVEIKQQQQALLNDRSELEVLVRQCLEDVKVEIEKHQMTDPPHSLWGDDVREMSVQERERVVELLLSQQRVVQLLYNKTFAHHIASTVEDTEAERSSSQTGHNGGGEDFSWLSNVIPSDDDDRDDNEGSPVG